MVLSKSFYNASFYIDTKTSSRCCKKKNQPKVQRPHTAPNTYDCKCCTWDFLMGSGDRVQLLLLAMKTLMETEQSPHHLPSLFACLLLYLIPLSIFTMTQKENITSRKENLQMKEGCSARRRRLHSCQGER